MRALRYYHRYITEHPDLRKSRHHLFVPIKDNNTGKELSAATIFRWIWTTIVDSHIPGTIKADEVHAVPTSLPLLNKVDLQAVMKARRWPNGGTFTSFYLRDLCPQADRIRKTGPVVAEGEIVLISSS